MREWTASAAEPRSTASDERTRGACSRNLRESDTAGCDLRLPQVAISATFTSPMACATMKLIAAETVRSRLTAWFLLRWPHKGYHCRAGQQVRERILNTQRPHGPAAISRL